MFPHWGPRPPCHLRRVGPDGSWPGASAVHRGSLAVAPFLRSSRLWGSDLSRDEENRSMISGAAGRVVWMVLLGCPAGIAAAGERVTPLADLPLAFEPNHGQAAPEVQFLSRAPGYLLQLTGTEMRLVVRASEATP